jgi:hypothetical protein
MTATKFSARFARTCDRCQRRIRPGEQIYRLDDASEICRPCALRQVTADEGSGPGSRGETGVQKPGPDRA